MNISCHVPVVENAFLASPPKHPLVSAWLQEMLRLEGCSEADLINATWPGSIQANLWPAYHFAYHAATRVFQTHDLAELGSMVLYNQARQFYQSGNMGANRTVSKLLTEPMPPDARATYHIGPLLKLIGSERDALDSALHNSKVEVPSNSFVGMLVNMSCLLCNSARDSVAAVMPKIPDVCSGCV